MTSKKLFLEWVLLLVIILILIIIGFILSNKSSGNIVSEEPVKICPIFTLSGNSAIYGARAKNGAEIAKDEINSKGGINGKKLEIIYEDGKASTSEAISSYNKLKNLENCKYILMHHSSIALALQPLSNKDKIILVDIASTTDKYSSPNDYSFRTGIVATQLAKEASDFLYNKFNAKKIAVLYINNDFGKGILDSFKENYKGEIVLEQSFLQDGNDFRTEISKLKTKNFDYILLVSHIKEGGIILKQARELGINANFFSDIYSVEAPEFLEIAGKSAEGLIYAAPKFDPNDKNPVVTSFVKKYKEKFNEDPVAIAAQSYDAIIALSKAIENCNPDDTTCVKNELMKLDFEGASGRIKFDINGDVIKPSELKTIKNGRFVKYE